MNAEEPKAFDSDTRPPTTRPRRKRTQGPVATKWNLRLFSGFAIWIGGSISVVALLRVIETLQGNPPKKTGWSLELGLVLLAFGVAAVVAGVAMWQRRRWGWWLMAGLLLVASLVVTQGAVISLGGIMIALWALRPLFGLPGPFHTLEPDIDLIAKNLGIDWAATPLARISELLAANQDIEATRLYREHFGCHWDEAHAGIARWQTDLVANKLRHIARVVNSQHQQADAPATFQPNPSAEQ